MSVSDIIITFKITIEHLGPFLFIRYVRGKGLPLDSYNSCSNASRSLCGCRNLATDVEVDDGAI